MLSAEPHARGAGRGLAGAGVDLGLGQRAQRMVYNNGHEVGHTEGGTLHLGFVQKFGRDDDCGRPPQRFQSNAVMRTARRA